MNFIQCSKLSLILSILLLLGCSGTHKMSKGNQPLAGIRITIDPGHGNTEAYDFFRIGPAGEREEWINLRVAKLLAKKLEAVGAEVLLTRTKDRDLSLGGRAALAKRHKSDLFISVHHNGSENDPGIDIPIVYFYGDAATNPASVDFARILLAEMKDNLHFEQVGDGAVHSDFLIYSSGTSILRNTVDVMPGVIGEGGFFTNPSGENRLMDRSYNRLEAEVYYRAILAYFQRGYPQAHFTLEDTLKYVVPGQVLNFELSDGLGGHDFVLNEFSALQDGEPLVVDWQDSTGILSVMTVPADIHEIRIQLFARNLRGNALHPKAFTFTTLSGDTWQSEELWSEAYEKASAIYAAIDTDTPALEQVDEALHLYRLSLELQPVHPKSRQAEEQILALLILKDTLVSDDPTEEIDAQRYRLSAFYP